MNETWIHASHYNAKRNQGRRGSKYLARFEYLDVMGLFETGWLVFNHNGTEYGYPTKKNLTFC